MLSNLAPCASARWFSTAVPAPACSCPPTRPPLLPARPPQKEERTGEYTTGVPGTAAGTAGYGTSGTAAAGTAGYGHAQGGVEAATERAAAEVRG